MRGAVDKTSFSFSAHGKIGNFIIIIAWLYSIIHRPIGIAFPRLFLMTVVGLHYSSLLVLQLTTQYFKLIICTDCSCLPVSVCVEYLAGSSDLFSSSIGNCCQFVGKQLDRDTAAFRRSTAAIWWIKWMLTLRPHANTSSTDCAQNRRSQLSLPHKAKHKIYEKNDKRKK